jgi:ribosome-associated protein
MLTNYQKYFTENNKLSLMEALLAKKAKDETQQRLLYGINAALQRKAKDLVIMKVKSLSAFADYFIICSATSDRQVKAIASWLQESLKKDGMTPLGIEGMQHGHWVLMDYGDIVIHIFYEPIREFYAIERLWSEAPKMMIDDNAVEIKTLEKGITD